MIRLFVILLSLALAGCAANRDIFPTFDGAITPITSPVNFVHSPGECKILIKGTAAQGRQKVNQVIELSYKSTQAAEAVDMLNVFLSIDSLVVDDKVFKHELPLALMSMKLTNKGKIVSLDTTFPAFEAVGTPIAKDSWYYREIEKAVSQNTVLFADKPIVSGEMLTQSVDGSHKQLVKSLDNLGSKLVGYSTYKDRVVVVSSIEGRDIRTQLDDNGTDVEILASFEGYTLSDAATMLPVKSELLMFGRTIATGVEFTARSSLVSR